MSVFLQTNHLFLRNPRGGVEDVAAMKAAGFGAIFCNVGDFAPAEWQTIRDRGRAAGVVVGPWLRTADQHDRFDYDRFHTLLRIADEWGTPLIVNSETELKGSGAEITSYIDAQLAGRDAALSMESTPFADVAWWPLAERPVLPQIFLADVQVDPESARQLWWAWGIRCVVLTFGAYGGSQPGDYPLGAPFGAYTADDMGQQYAAWKATGTCQPCGSSPNPTPPDGGDDMQLIGSQNGITATFNRLRDLDPAGTLLKKDGQGKWPSITTISSTPLDKWKAYDKGERTLSILAADHDAQAQT